MRLSPLAQHALGTSLIALMLAGCNGAGTTLALRPPETQNDETSLRSARGHSWMNPSAVPANLLYVSSNALGDRTVYVFAYPKGRLVGKLNNFSVPQGMCVDAAGDIFITDTPAQQIDEYAHGGTTPIATLSDPNGFPQGCSVDPTTGNLAVADIEDAAGPSYNPGNIAVYAGASGTPTYYANPGAVYRPYFCTYDSNGNLFIDGGSLSGSFELAELPKNGASFNSMTLNQYIQTAGGLQWYGKHLAIADEGNGYQGATAVYEFKVKNGAGTLVGTTPFPGAYGINQFWINPGHTKIVAADYRANSPNVGIYAYPAGGSALNTIAVGAGGLFAVTVSRVTK